MVSVGAIKDVNNITAKSPPPTIFKANRNSIPKEIPIDKPKFL